MPLSQLGICVAFCVLAASAGEQSIEFRDLRPASQRILAKRGVSASQFPALVQAIDQETATRLAEGESDHLIYFVLQSTEFTRRARIEPALSARELVESLGPEERAGYLSGQNIAAPRKIPRDVAARIEDFLRALTGSRTSERLGWFRKTLPASERTPEYLSAEYIRAMRFLYQKEFGGVNAQGALYQSRGHSSDTRVESSFAVWTALGVIRAINGAATRINRVLIVGPGLDFAPRTDLIDSYPPQSYQPFAVADALLELGLAVRDQLRMDCIDINGRVVDFFREFRNGSERRLILVRSWDDPEYVSYFEKLGRHVGQETPMSGGKTLRIDRRLAGRITASKGNIITERPDPPAQYDLIVATNVFVYFDDTELLLALSNIDAMLAPGGYLIHNELRGAVEEFATALGLAPVQARTLHLAGAGSHALFDSFVIHRKAP